jgi:phasin family protein
MVQINDQVAALSKTQMDTAVKGAEVAVDALGKLTELQFETAKAAYAEGSRALRQMAAVKDPSQWASLPAGAAQPAWDTTSSFAKSAYDIVAGAQSEYAALLEQHVAQFNKSMVVVLDAAAKSAPPGSEGVMNAVKSAVHSTNSWYETAVKTARQMAATAEASVASMTAQASPARRKAA